MSWTKRQFIEQAFIKIGYANYVYDLQDEQLQSVLYELDAMIGTWNGKGIRIGFPLTNNPEDSSLDTKTSVPDFANQAIYTNLAILIAPNFGKVTSRELRVSARQGYKTLLNRANIIQEQQFPDTLPAGAGNKPGFRNDPFMPKPDDPIETGDDDILEFIG